MHDKFNLIQANIVPPPNIRYLVFENWTKREVKKKLLRNRVEKGKVLSERVGGGEFQIVSSVFLKKSMFSLLLELLSGKYSHLL